MLDLDKILSSYNNDLTQIRKLINTFKKEYQKIQTANFTALMATNQESLIVNLHSLKGMVSYFYCHELVDLIEKTEAKARDNSISKEDLLHVHQATEKLLTLLAENC